MPPNWAPTNTSIAYKMAPLALGAAKIRRAEFLPLMSYHPVGETDWESTPQNTRWKKIFSTKERTDCQARERSHLC